MAAPLTFFSPSGPSALLSLLAFCIFDVSRAALFNTTVDDWLADSTNGIKPVYEGPWNIGQQCTTCAITFDTTKAHDGTWHDITLDAGHPNFASLSLTFNGTAVYVFGVLPKSAGTVVTNANMTFTLDGSPAGSYVREAGADDVYDTLLFNQSSLANTQHTLLVRPEFDSYMAFDYAIYTSDDASSTSSAATAQSTGETSTASPTSSSSTTTDSSIASSNASSKKRSATRPTIIGAVVGAVVLFALGGALYFLYRRRSRRDNMLKPETQPFFFSGGPSSSMAVAPPSSAPQSPPRREKGLPPAFSPPTFPASNPSTQSFGTMSMSEPSAPSRSGRSASRQEELAHRVWETEQTVAAMGSVPHADQALRDQVEALKREVLRLKVEQQKVGTGDAEAPPAYGSTQ